MTNLILDIGNTNTKLAICKDRQILFSETKRKIHTSKIAQYLDVYQVTHSIFSNVSRMTIEAESLLQDRTQMTALSSHVKQRLAQQYNTPESLGTDRLAGIIAATTLSKALNILVVDAGSCITYDLINKQDGYKGGCISPGICMRFNALHSYTGHLPLVQTYQDVQEAQGHDTNSALQIGVLQGVYFEVLGFIQKYSQLYAPLHMMITGGDAAFLYDRLQNTQFARNLRIEPHLVIIGLNQILYQQNG